MVSRESNGNSTRLSMDVANLPLTPFGMKHNGSPRKLTSPATNRFNKLSRRKCRDFQYRDKENIGGFNSQHRRQLPVGDAHLVGLHTVPEEKNCPESSCTSGKDSQIVANLRPTVDLSVAGKTQSTRDTRSESTGRRDSVYTDIDDGSFIEFCHGKEKGHYVPSSADDPSRKITLYYTCETNNDTQYSTSTKTNNARVGFRKYLDKLRMQRNLRNVSKDSETEKVKLQDNINKNNLLDETVITCSADMRKFQYKGPPPPAVNSTVMDNLPHDEKVPLPHVFSEISTLTIQSEMAVGQEPHHQSNNSQGQSDKYQIVVLSDSSDEESQLAVGGGDYGLTDLHSNTRDVPRSDGARVPPLNRNYGDAFSMPVNSSIVGKVKVFHSPPSPELVPSVIGKHPSVISEDISVISSTQELQKESRQVVPKSTDVDVLSRKETKVPMMNKNQKNVQDHINLGHVTPGRHLVSVKSNADKQTPEKAINPVHKWVMSSPFKESSFDSSFLQKNEDSFINESPSQSKLDPKNESLESHARELNCIYLTNPNNSKVGINSQSFGKSHDPSIVEKSIDSDDNVSDCDFAIRRTAVTQRVIVSTTEESEDDRRNGRYVTHRRKKKHTKRITESFEKDWIGGSDSENEESLCLRLSKSKNETNWNLEKTTQTIGKAAISPETKVKNFNKTDKKAPQWLKKSNQSCHEDMEDLQNEALCSDIWSPSTKLSTGANKEPFTTHSCKTGNSKYTGDSDGPLDLSLIRKELDNLYTAEWRKNEDAIFKTVPKEGQQDSRVPSYKSFTSNKRRSKSCPRFNMESEEESSFLYKVSETSGDGDTDTNSSEEERHDCRENNKSNSLNNEDEKGTKMMRTPDSPEEDSFEEYLKKAKALTQKKKQQEPRYYYESEDRYEPSFINDESSDDLSYSLPSLTQKPPNNRSVNHKTRKHKSSVSKTKLRGRKEERHESSSDEVNPSDRKDQKISKTMPEFEEDSFEEYLKKAKALTQKKKQHKKVLHSDDSEDQYDSNLISDDSSDDSYMLPSPIQKSSKILSENSGFPKHKKRGISNTGKDTGPKTATTWRDSPTIILTSDSDSDEFYSFTETNKKVVQPRPSFVTPRTKPRGKVLPKTEGHHRQFVKKYETGGLSPRLPFLASLSSNVNIIQCHPEALPYIKDFKKKKEELAEKLYKYYNTHVFDDKLPSSMDIKWNARLRKTAGYCYYQINKSTECRRGSRIELSTKVIDCAERVRDTLIHEMCHAAAWIISGYKDGHGPLWKAWAGKARAVFPELPAINRCHNYQIQCKYTYRCTRCQYSIGRHSKSLDTNKKVCGYCLGKFELLVNSKTQKNQSKTTPGTPACNPRTPKTPGPFALFVKENYGSIKKSTPNVKHGDVMKILSAKFEKMKTGGSQVLSS